MNTDRVISLAQIILSTVFLVGYFQVLGKFLDGNIATPPEWKDVLTALISLLTAGVLMILQFWFNRGRQSSPALPVQE